MPVTYEMAKSGTVYINPYSGIVGKKLENLSKNYGIIILDIQSKGLANINQPGHIIYGDESVSVEGKKEDVERFIHDASTPKRLEQRLN